MCNTDGSSVSVIEETLTYNSIFAAVRVLGFSLSAHFDGDGNGCSSSEIYIMSSSASLDKITTQNHHWQFSKCSVAYFTNFLQQLMSTSRGVSCLTGHPPVENTIPDVSGRLLGQEIPPDQQCQTTYGPDSKICVGLQRIGSEICQGLPCWDKLTSLCYLTEPLVGTSCGNTKICRSGLCVSDPQAPTVDESCIFGDQAGIVGQGMTCPQIVNNFKGVCYDSQNLLLCCKSCRAAYETVKDCEYGDRLTGCTSELCSQYPVGCCGTCKNGVSFTTKRMSIITYAPRPSNQISEDNVCRNRAWDCYFLKESDITQCYDDSFNKNCCQFCLQHLTKIPGCEYGDHTPELCTDESICHSYPSLCCHLCTKSSTTSSTKSSTKSSTNSSTKITSNLGLPHLQIVWIIVIVICLTY